MYRGASVANIAWNTGGTETSKNRFQVIYSSVQTNSVGNISCSINGMRYSAQLSIIGKYVLIAT